MMPVDSDMLTQAIERNSAAVLSLPSAGMVRYHKTRFLRCVDNRLWVESVPAERVLIESLIQDKQQVMVSFKAGTRKASFTSPICSLDCKYKFFDTGDPLQALEMVRPATVQPLQRRSHYRVPVRDSDRFSIQVWRIAEHVHLDDEPPELGFMPAIVRDLSVGGVGVVFPTRPVLATDQRVRILLRHGDSPPMLIEGRSCPLRALEDGLKFEAGLQFQNLQASLRGRQLITDLTRIVQGLQLQEAKRIRGNAA
jgi:c-di-GMP-binding flagellar brake protein YcgR